MNTDTLCNYGYVYEHCAAFVIMDTHDLYQNIHKLWNVCEQLDMHVSVPEHSYLYDNTFMSSIVLYE